MEKKTAARRAAAKYSTDLILATNEFAKLTYPSEQLSKDKFDDFQQEMLSLLSPYRHPVRYGYIEHLYFINPDFALHDPIASSFPDFMRDLNEAGVEPSVLEAVGEYVREFERNKAELLKLQEKYTRLENRLDAAKKAYEDNPSQPAGVKNTATVQALGLSDGKRGIVYDKERLWADNVKLVRREGMARRDAVREVKNRHGRASYDATIKALKDQKRIILKKWKKFDPSDHNRSRSRLKGIIPQDR